MFVKPEVNGGPPEVPDLLKTSSALAIRAHFRFSGWAACSRRGLQQAPRLLRPIEPASGPMRHARWASS
jgi:hypothetical protein